MTSRAIFFGTPEISVAALDALHEVAEIVAVICQPDRPAGRGLQLREPAVKSRAQQLGLPVHQPDKVRTKSFARWIESLQAELALVIAYGRILPKRVLDAPRAGCLNLHASLLPKYRGAAPITWAVVHGESETGITLMQMDEGCDTGPMLSQHTLALGPNETAGELYERMTELAAEVVRRDLLRALAGELKPIPQAHDQASLAPLLSKDDGEVDFRWPAKRVHDHVRGMTPWPGAHSSLDGKRFKILSTRLALPEGTHGEPGSIIGIADQGALVACGTGTVAIVRGQIAGKKPLDATQLWAGRTLANDKSFDLFSAK